MAAALASRGRIAALRYSREAADLSGTLAHEHRAQPCVGAVQPHLHHALRDAEQLGHLLRRQALDVSQHHDRTSIFRQLSECCFRPCEQVGGFGGVIRSDVGAGEQRVVAGQRKWCASRDHPCRARLRPFAQEREADVDRDAVQPGAEGGIATEPHDRTHHAHEHLLGRVRRFVRVGQHAPAQRIDICVGRTDQRVESACLTFLAGPDERRVDVHPTVRPPTRPDVTPGQKNSAKKSPSKKYCRTAVTKGRTWSRTWCERRAARREGGTKMYAFVVFVGLALALAVVGEVLDEVLPIKAPRALTTTVTVAVAILAAWAIDYSVFRAFGQSLRANWMHPVATGIVLVGAGEFLRALAGSLGISISMGNRDRTKTA